MTHAQIRYQGVLHSIDPAAATVSLERGASRYTTWKAVGRVDGVKLTWLNILQSARSVQRAGRRIPLRRFPLATRSTSAFCLLDCLGGHAHT